LRADYRETLSQQPDFWTKSYASLRESALAEGQDITIGRLEKFGPLRQQRVSAGVGITF
jgi:hypothetical protein